MTGDKLSKYRQFDENDVEDVDKAVDSISGSIYVDLKEGENVLRVLPGPSGADGWPTFLATAIHYIEPLPGMTDKIVFHCPLFVDKLPCPACAESQRLMSSRNPVDKKRASDMSAGSRVYANVLNRANPAAGPRVLSMGPTIWRKIRDIRKSPRAGGDMTDPTSSGFDIIIQREGTKMQTKYDVFADRNSSPLAVDAQEMEEILGRQHDLKAIIDSTVPTELIQAFGQVARAGRTPAPAQQTRRSAADDARKPAAAAPQGKVVETTGETVDPDDPANWT